MRTTLALNLALASIGLAAAPVAANDVMVRVNYEDLDLSQPAHVETLKKRVMAKIRAACEPDSSILGGYGKCKRAARDQAMREIERHRLRYASLNGPTAG